MEFKIIEQTMPGALKFNYEELKNEIAEKAQLYETLVYTDENISDAKNDRANLNKLKTALNKERIAREKEYMKPFEVFKSQVNEIIGILDKPIGIIDAQVKEYEESEKKKKKEDIESIWTEENTPSWMHLEQIWNEKWLNKSYSMSNVKKDISEALEKVKSDVETIGSLSEYGFEALECYKKTLDIGRAIAEGQRLADIQRRKEEAEQKAAEQKAAEQQAAEMNAEPEKKKDAAAEPMESIEKPQGKWIGFQAYLTTEQAIMLRDFFRANNIDFRPMG